MKIELPAFNVAGVQSRPVNVIDVLVDGQEIRFVAEPENQFDMFAIKVEARIGSDLPDQDEPGPGWAHIGYVPKKSTWIFHLLRQAGVKIHLSLLVNHDATDKDKLLVSSFIEGDKNASFL